MPRRKTLARHIKDFVPILHWLPKYRFKDNILKDVIGGLTVGIMHIPQGMAYASLANLNPVNGLYTSFFPPLIYMIFGTSRHVSLGVFAVVSLIAGSCNVRVTEELFYVNGSIYESADRDYISLRVSTSLTFFSGLIGILLALLKLDLLIAFLSDHVIKGFTTGAAFHVFVAQLNKVMGLKLPRKSGLGKLFNMVIELGTSTMEGHVNYFTVLISAITVIILYCSKEYLNPVVKRRLKTVPVPYDLIVMIVGVIFSYLLNLNGWLGVRIIGHIPTGLPFPEAPDLTLYSYVIKDAISVTLVSLVITISMGKLFAKKHNYSIDVRQEFYAIGLCGILGSLFPIWPPSTALARTIVYEGAGTKTQLATVFSCLLLLLVMLFLGPFLATLPVCLLSCIIIVALKGMFIQLKEIPQLWKVSKLDALTFLLTMLITVACDVVEGLLVGVVFSALVVIYRAQRISPTVLKKGWDLERRSDLLIKLDSPLFYLNTEKVKKDVDLLIKEHYPCSLELNSGKAESTPLTCPKTVSIDMSSVSFIDYSGISCLLEIISEHSKLKLVFLNTTDSVREAISRHLQHEKITIV